MSLSIKSLDEEFVRINTIGDGSCMFHAILQCFNKTYINSNTEDKIKIIKQFRKDLSNILDEDMGSDICYNQLSRGKLKEISSDIPDVSLENMKNDLDSSDWGDIRFLEFISNILNINVFIIYSGNNDLYQTGESDLYIKNRDSIIVYNNLNVHFESIGLKSKNTIRTLFSYEDSVIKKLRSKLYKGK